MLSITARAATTLYALRVRHGLAAVARTCDVAILGEDQSEAAYAVSSLYERARPVMSVPKATEGAAARSPGTAARTAARAVNDATPLLDALDAVELVCVRQETRLRDELPGFEITQHLVRHEIDAVLHEVPVLRNDAIDTQLVS